MNRKSSTTVISLVILGPAVVGTELMTIGLGVAGSPYTETQPASKLSSNTFLTIILIIISFTRRGLVSIIRPGEAEGHNGGGCRGQHKKGLQDDPL